MLNIMRMNTVAIGSSVPTTAELRREVRAFLRSAIEDGAFVPRCNSWMTAFSPGFSRMLAERGWLGLTWAQEYGGRGATTHHRLVLTEELLAHGAPVAAHWIADRQMGPNLIRFGSEEQKRHFLPQIARAEAFFCIGMSEPDSGSDLASIRTSATKVPGGWRVSGTKVWTTGAHIAQFMMTLVRTDRNAKRRAGLSQLIVDLTADGVRVSPIIGMDGGHHFNEVFLDSVFVPDDMLVGTEGAGWQQVTAELSFERSGPERYMSTTPLLLEWGRLGAAHADRGARADLGLLVARLLVLRRMSAVIAGRLAAGETPDVEAAMVKDLGGQFERDVIGAVRRHRPLLGRSEATRLLDQLLAEATVQVPTFGLRGGTPEILRGVIARDLGIR